jgi:hypothetical protein
MSKTIPKSQIGLIVAGLRLLQTAILNHTLDQQIEEIAIYGRGTLPTSAEINALCEQVGGGGMSDTAKWVIVVGTLGNLEKVVGPFPTESDAREFAVGHAGEDRYEGWVSMPMTAPADEEERRSRGTTKLTLVMEIEGDDPTEVANAAESLSTHADNVANNYPVTVVVSEEDDKEGDAA